MLTTVEDGWYVWNKWALLYLCRPSFSVSRETGSAPSLHAKKQTREPLTLHTLLLIRAHFDAQLRPRCFPSHNPYTSSHVGTDLIQAKCFPPSSFVHIKYSSYSLNILYVSVLAQLPPPVFALSHLIFTRAHLSCLVHPHEVSLWFT